MKALLIDQIAKVNYKYSFNLANGIRDQGVELAMVIDLKEETDGCRCPMIRMFNTDEKNIGKVKKLANYISSVHKILKLLKKEQYDILHTQWVIFSPMDYLFLKKAKKRTGKLIVTVHDILPFNEKFYDYHFHKKIYELADEIIVQTEDNKERFAKLFPKIRTPRSVIPHGHFLEYADPMEKGAAREKLGIAREEFVFLFFGQIKKVKGVDILLEAYAKLLENRPELRGKTRLVIAGSVWKADFGKCEEIIAKRNMEPYIRTDIKYIPDEEVGAYYSAADVCVLPYLDVYQSGVLQLTYAYKKAAIVTELPAFVDIIDETRGFVCKKNDAGDLARAMEDAYYERESLEKKAQSGYEYIKERFDWGKIGRQITELYQRI